MKEDTVRVTLKLTLDHMSDYGASRTAILEALADLLDGEILEVERYNPKDNEDDFAEYQIVVSDAARNADRKKTP